MRRLIHALVGIALASASANAHEADGRNGSRLVDAGRYHVELVGKDTAVEVYLLDGDEKPVATSGYKGIAILILDGKPIRVALAPAEPNRLTGAAQAALPVHPKGAVQITAPDGTSASGKFE